MTLRTKTTSAKPETNSIRVTIPEGIVDFLGLKAGDAVDWQMEVDAGMNRSTKMVRVITPRETEP
jgi:antitoxin component of MazEF toxin-antitoxin module